MPSSAQMVPKPAGRTVSPHPSFLSWGGPFLNGSILHQLPSGWQSKSKSKTNGRSYQDRAGQGIVGQAQGTPITYLPFQPNLWYLGSR